MAVPVVLTAWYVHAFGVNVPFADSWNGTLPIVRAMATGHLYFSQLYAPHNENRLLFPNLILGLVDSHEAANAKIDMYLTLVIMAIGLVLLIATARRSTGLGPLALVPLAFLLFDWVQVENLLWAYQLAWLLIASCLFLTLWALGRGSGPGWFVLATAAALVASFSSLQGLLLWPVGLLYAGLSGWRPGWLGAWVGLAVGALVGYLWGFGPLGASGGLHYDLQHPITAAEYFVRLVGSTVPTNHHLTAGAAILAASVVVAYLALQARVELQRVRLPLALWLMGFLFDILVTAGRSPLAVPASSRYTTYNLMLVAGLYLGAAVLLVPAAARLRAKDFGSITGGAELISLLVVAAVIATLAVSIPAGVGLGQTSYRGRERDADLLRSYRTTPAPKLAASLFPPSGPYVKEWAAWLQSRHWSVFS